MMQAQHVAYGGPLNTFDEGGDIKGIYEMPLRQRIQYARTGKITNAGYPIIPINKGYGALRALSRFKKAIKDRPWDPNSAFNTVIKGAMNDVDKTPVGWDKKYGSKALQLGKSIFNQIVGGKGEKLGIT
jgi:hypothetical protein